MQEIAYAKINLALHVSARRADGYHELETLFVFAEDGDILTAEPDKDLTLTIGGPFSTALHSDDDNLVLRAARAVQAKFGIASGVAVHLDKRLPVAAGIGGGSADAAAAMRLLARMWGLDIADPRMTDIASKLGADVPACLASQTVRGESIGDVLVPVEAPQFAAMPILLINDLTPCPTGLVFAGWNGKDRGPLATDTTLDSIIVARNDLEAPATALVPQIADLLSKLSTQQGCTLARMSGSGATCFALFDTEEHCRKAAQSFPGIWTMATRLR